MSLTRRDFARTTLAAAGAAVATLAAPVAQALPHARTAGGPPQAWMSALPDATSMLRLTIPGTHDSCCVSAANGTEWAHTQNWSLPEQFAHGIRFLDIRCNGLQDHTADSFGIYHAQFFQGITFDTVLDQCRAFLSRNPGEVLVIRVKKEDGTNDDVGANFERIFDGYLDVKGYRPLFWLENRIPSLGEARGKIVLIAQFANSLGCLQWPGGDNGVFTSDRFYLQDRYKDHGLAGLDSGSSKSGSADLGSSDVGSSGGDKFAYVSACFDKAAGDPANALQYINFTSFADSAWPKDNAAAIMPKVESYLSGHRGQAVHYGIVPMDFPDQYPTALNLLLEFNAAG
ncbi:phosphatidylinositol-specific phospholipase C domain-containing protein [Nocardia yunnanensis]|uniref:1-phosphatidylinositol phosphodiesterase n=1 Tax=Nocardia yunnanensis TaxID=2382165 RepID=A0A386ZFK8_9NOCA|nr:phosphatidylinositol-specific phospholipase C [Nocardia yunnanensis]AYF75924.1 phosphatidylinositol-specific phospholipase C domain-containing protein [Nocardia yunnanensis]